MSKELSKTNALALVQAVLLVIIGVLVICSFINDQVLQIIVAICLTVFGCFLLFESVYKTKSLVSLGALGGGILLGVGIACFASVISVTSIFTPVVQVGILSTGILLCTQGIVYLVQKRASTFATAYLVIGLIAIVFGILLLINLFDNNNKLVTSIVAGIVLIALGTLNLVATLIKLSRQSNSSNTSSSSKSKSKSKK